MHGHLDALCTPDRYFGRLCEANDIDPLDYVIHVPGFSPLPFACAGTSVPRAPNVT